MTIWPVSCSTCGEAVDPSEATVPEDARQPCPACGSLARTFHVSVSDTIKVYDGLTLKARHGEPGQVKPYLEHADEVRWNGDRQRLERRVMRVDRENDQYTQEWSALDTGESTYSKTGRLSDPKMHGVSARRGKDTGDGGSAS